MPMADFIYIKHPDIQALGGPVTREALTEVFEDKGWLEASDEEVREHTYGLLFRAERAANLTEEDVDAVKRRADLDKLALDRGVDPTKFDNMTQLAGAIKSTTTKE